MSGIPVYTQSPISASKASGATPQTATPAAPSSSASANYTPASTTASATSSYPSAQPGAAAPAPTGAAAQRYAPLQPTPTVKTDNGPPAPQPGAFPVPTNRSAVPPPPKAGEKYQPQQTPVPTQPTQAYPPQMSYGQPATYGGVPPASTTSTSTAPSALYPVAIPSAETGGPRRSLEHPPGYHQNVYASDLSSDQRRATEAQQQTNYTSRSQDNAAAGGFESDSVWDTAKKWAQTAGEKISEAEAEVWKRVNKE